MDWCAMKYSKSDIKKTIYLRSIGMSCLTSVQCVALCAALIGGLPADALAKVSNAMSAHSRGWCVAQATGSGAIDSKKCFVSADVACKPANFLEESGSVYPVLDLANQWSVKVCYGNVPPVSQGQTYAVVARFTCDAGYRAVAPGLCEANAHVPASALKSSTKLP